MSDTGADVMYRASADVFSAAAQIARVPPPSPDALRQEIIGLLRQFVARCREAKIDDTEIAEARYALVAFVDDRVLKSNWIGREAWMNSPLQLQLFREFTAGENFFARMRALIRRGEPVLALEVYYLCMALGFAGAIQAAGGAHGTESYVEPARALLLRGVGPDRVAPNAVPTQRHRLRRRAIPVAAMAVAACAVLCISALVGLHTALGSAIRRATPSLVDEVRGAPNFSPRP